MRLLFLPRACLLASILLPLELSARGTQGAGDVPALPDVIVQQAYLKPSSSTPNAYFGRSVATSGDTVLVGAPGEDGAYVFVRSGATWILEARLVDPVAGFSLFGGSVSIFGDTAVVGDPGEGFGSIFPDSTGAVYVFVRNGTTWSQQARLRASNHEPDDNFGCSVSVFGDTLVVGAMQEESNATGVNGDQNDNSASWAGAAYVFVREGTTWSQQAYLKASNTEARDQFGWELSLSGDTVVVGAFSEDSNATGVDGEQSDNSATDSGAAYVFVREGTTWSQQAYLKASNTAADDAFGLSVSISGDTLVVGAEGEDSLASGVDGDQENDGAPDSGAAYVFVRGGTSWSQQAYLKPASNSVFVGSFGASVSVFGDTTVVGAPDELNSSGAAYVLARSGTTWSHQAYLRASNAQHFDEFGLSVSVAGGTVVVGAPREDSNATGVNGNQFNNNATNSGAAYVFGPPTGPYLTAISPATIEALIPGTAQSIHLSGLSLDLATEVILNDAAIEPARYTLVSSELITLDMPQVTPLGTHFLAVTDGSSISRLPVVVVAPTMPRYENASGDPLVLVDRDDGLTLRLAGIPGRAHLVVLSVSDLPSANRFVSLGLGNQFTNLVLGRQVRIPASAWIEVEVPAACLLNNSLIGVPLYSQTIDLTFPAPLPVSNLQSLILTP